jgi:hypothetical protein
VGADGATADDFTYIWVANSPQGTISKLDTRTIIEEGRYRSRPDTYGDPSRTSVNLSGDVAVANRSGGLTKIYARVGDCQDTNGTPGIQTSSGKDDILDWGQRSGLRCEQRGGEVPESGSSPARCEQRGGEVPESGSSGPRRRTARTRGPPSAGD